MKYMLLIYTAENAITEEERQHCYEESTALTHELNSRGQFISASPLQPVATATTVRVREGKRLGTDGPFAETRELLGGYFMVAAIDPAVAMSIARRVSLALIGTVVGRRIGGRPKLPKVAK